MWFTCSLLTEITKYKALCDGYYACQVSEYVNVNDCIKLLIKLVLIVSKFQKCACPSEVRSGVYSSGKSFFEAWIIKQKFNLDMNIPMRKHLIPWDACGIPR